VTDLIELAARFSEAAHESIKQVRKFTGEPYFQHPKRVAAMVEATGASDLIVAAAYLHDVVEDVPFDNVWSVALQFGFKADDFAIDISADENTAKFFVLDEFFGNYVSHLVSQVTDVSKPSDGNRKIRKELDRQHLVKASPQAQTIKLADLIDNSHDIIQHDPDFAVTYMREKGALLEVLTEGNKELWGWANYIIEMYGKDPAWIDWTAVSIGVNQKKVLNKSIAGAKPGHRFENGKCLDCKAKFETAYKTCQAWGSSQ